MALKTLSDVFNPLQAAAQVEKINAARQQQEMNKLKIMQQQAQMAKTKQFNQYQQGVQAQATHQVNPMQLQKGKTEAQAIAKSLEKSIAGKNYDAINKLGQMAEKNQNVQAFMLQASPDLKVKVWSDPKAQEAHINYSGNFSREMLDKMADSAAGAGFLKGLPPGRYELDYDPIGKTFRPSATPVEDVSKRTALTGTQSLSDNQLFRGVALGDPLAKKVLDEKMKYLEQTTARRSGQMTEEGVELGATQYLLTGKMPALGRGGANRAKIANRAAQIAKDNNLSSPQLYGKRTGLTTAQKSYNKQRVNLDADIKIANEFYADIARFKPQIEKLRTNYPSLVNQSLIQIQKMAASPQLGEQAVLAQELDAILSAYIRIARDASGTISEMTVGAQQAAKKLLNFNSPAFVLMDQVENFEDQIRSKINSRTQSVDNQFQSIEKFATLKREKGKDKKPKFVIEAVE